MRYLIVSILDLCTLTYFRTPKIECICIEIQPKQTRILFELFYRPPNSDALYLSAIEDSISLALDTQISNIIVTGDFNLNVLNPLTSNKISDICTVLSVSNYH